MTPLSGLDGTFLHLETPETPMHVASLHLFNVPGGPRADHAAWFDAVKSRTAARLGLAPVLQRRLAPMPLQMANPAWVHDDAVDIDWHVRHLRLAAPGTDERLFETVAHLHADLLDRARPLWRLYVIDGLASGQVAYYIKVHHALLDGQAGVLLAQVLFDDRADAPAAPRVPVAPRAGERPGALTLAAAALRHDAAQYVKLLRHLPDVARTLAGLAGAGGRGAAAGAGVAQSFAFGPKTALNTPITAARGFAGASLPLQALKDIAARHDAKLNDVVLALASGTLRRWLAAHGGVPRRPLIAAMPISLRAAGNVDYTTQATMSLVNLHTHVAHPVRRLHAIRDAAAAVKALAGRVKGVLPTDFPTLGAPWLMPALARLYAGSGVTRAVPPIANVVISNVPGPPQALYAAGARMTHYWPLSIVEHGLGLNLTVMSYAGAMGFGFVTARAAVPDASELVAALHASMAELVDATGGRRAASQRHAPAGARRRRAEVA
ncbi:MAG: wax ester/triacylglycerol synthase family O-acyltransferase [Rubrivivax sp.]|jgi:WS/DGAT/MGAT family acyltransferase|nr:wax ester/triacylglycerol synthase family O-acyltransferase [Rubrivivax sp.]